MPRLNAELWVQAYIRRLQLADIAVYVAARGDANAGAVVVKLATLDGRATAWERSFDLARDSRIWVVLAEGAEPEVDAALARARARDRDLWIVEIEDRQGRSLLDQDGLSGD